MLLLVFLFWCSLFHPLCAYITCRRSRQNSVLSLSLSLCPLRKQRRRITKGKKEEEGKKIIINNIIINNNNYNNNGEEDLSAIRTPQSVRPKNDPMRTPTTPKSSTHWPTSAQPGSQPHIHTPTTNHQLSWCDALMASSSLIVCGGERRKKGKEEEKRAES